MLHRPCIRLLAARTHTRGKSTHAHRGEESTHAHRGEESTHAHTQEGKSTQVGSQPDKRNKWLRHVIFYYFCHCLRMRIQSLQNNVTIYLQNNCETNTRSNILYLRSFTQLSTTLIIFKFSGCNCEVGTWLLHLQQRVDTEYTCRWLANEVSNRCWRYSSQDTECTCKWLAKKNDRYSIV